MAGHARVADGGHALAGKWPRRPMGALLALAPNPIDTRAFATRALATAPESAGIGDMQGKATPGLGPWAGASPLPGRMLPLPRRRPRRMRRTKGSRQGRSRIGSMRKSRLRMRWRRPCGRRTTIGGDPGTLEEHFNAHGMDVGASSMEEYADMTHEFYLNKDSTR